jgi:chemosensory pili system protein ChpA (sensor histidine kinase/response regulator)
VSLLPEFPEESSVEERTFSSSTVEEPVLSTPVVDEPTFSTPTVDEPTLQTPAAEEPALLTPAVEEPTLLTPAVEEPTFSTPAVDEPMFSTSVADEPTFSTPAFDELPSFSAPVLEELPSFFEPSIPTPQATLPIPPMEFSPESELQIPVEPVYQEPVMPEPVKQEPVRQEAAAPTPTANDEISIELAEVFAMEADEHLRSMTSSLQILEHNHDRKDLVQTIRRSAHSLKGSAAMVGYRNITNLAHRMEDLLDLLYDGERVLTPELVQLLFTSTYLLEDMSNGQAAADAVARVYAEYTKLLDTKEDNAVAPVQQAPVESLQADAAEDDVEPTEQLSPAEVEQGSSQPMQRAATATARTGQIVRVPIERLDELVKLVSELVITQTSFEQGMSDLGRQLAELQSSSSRMRRVSSKLETQYEASTLGGSRSIGPQLVSSGHVTNSSVTFNTHGFDALEFDRYTEFHLLSREMTETTSDLDTVSDEFHALASDFDSYLNRQTRLFSEIQDRLMRIRMVPLSNIASRLHRIVRHVARKQGKQVELILEGEETGLDKTVLEEIVDPFQHLLRNAVDHGMELPDVREAHGKPARGRIRIRAYYEGTQVVVQISDDGRGLDLDRIRAEAVSGGYISGADLPAMSDQELFALIFTPGFSTSPQVSEISGRGVGLDVVKDAVHKLKGTVAVESVRGRGTTFTIRLPMTLAVIKALFVNASGQTYAIPLSVVTQIMRLEQGTIETIGQDSVLRINGQIYPLMWLSKLLHSKTQAETQITRPPVLIVNIEGKRIALVVDELMGGREIVIKNLANHLRSVSGVMGATLMGDGSVVLILNLADYIRETARPAAQNKNVVSMPTAANREALTVMIVDDSPSVRRVSTNLVKSAGWSSLQAKDGLEALEILHQLETLPDLMLLDIEMPRMDGYELLSTLRSQGAYRNLPVVVVTSRASDKHRQKAFAVGATEYLVKPYQDEMLVSLIRRLVRENRRALA